MKTKITTGPITQAMREQRLMPDVNVHMQVETASDSAFLAELERLGVAVPESPHEQAKRKGTDAAIAELREIIEAGVSFNFGKVGEGPQPDWVNVARQYGVPEDEQWCVVQVSYTSGVVRGTARSFREQAVALFFGKRMLYLLRHGR